MICEDCKVAGFINEEANEQREVRPDGACLIYEAARRWHRKCLSWRGRNKHGCTCQHKVGDHIDQSQVSLEERKRIHESRKAQFGPEIGEIA